MKNSIKNTQDFVNNKTTNGQFRYNTGKIDKNKHEK